MSALIEVANFVTVAAATGFLFGLGFAWAWRLVQPLRLTSTTTLKLPPTDAGQGWRVVQTTEAGEPVREITSAPSPSPQLETQPETQP